MKNPSPSALFHALTVLFLIQSGCVKGPDISEPVIHEPATAVSLDITNFDSLVIDSDTTAIVEFFSQYCPVCNAMSWVIDSLAILRGDSVLTGVIDVALDDTLWRRYSVQHVPAFLIFKDGVLAYTGNYSQFDPHALDTLNAALNRVIYGDQ